MFNSRPHPENVYETGNRKFFAAQLNPDGSYGVKEYHEGIMTIEVSWESETTNISADDNPRFVQFNSPLKGSASFTFTALPFAFYTKFFDARVDKNGAIVVSSRNKPKEVGVGFSTTRADGVEIMYTLYSAVLKMPALETASFDGQTIRNVTIEADVYPYAIKDGNKVVETVSYSILSSDNPAWEAAQRSIYIPDTNFEEVQ